MTLRPTNGVQVDESEQGSDGWLAMRCGKFTASKAGDLMIRGKNGQALAAREAYIEQIIGERLTGELPKFFETDAMREGKERERTAALAYSFETSSETVQSGFWHKGYYGASPDDLLVGQKGGVEYKNPMVKTHLKTLIAAREHDDAKDVIPPYYYWQILQCMLVTGAEFWDYVSYHPAFPANAQLFIKRVERKDVEKDLLALRTELAQANKEVEQIVADVTAYSAA